MANKYMKKCSTSLAIKEMEIKTTLRFHFTSVRMAIIKNKNNKCSQGCREKGILMQHEWKGKLVQPLWIVIWRFLKKVKAERPYNPPIPFLGIYLKEYKSGYNKDSCTSIFIVVYCSTISNSQAMGRI
jgi:hypothetical protein